MARLTKAARDAIKQEQAAFINKIKTAVPNEHQQHIFAAAQSQIGQYVVLAGPGSGKTFTSIKSSTNFTGSSVYFSYNKKIQMDTHKKLVAINSKMSATTAHAFGLACLMAYTNGKAKVDDQERKYPDIVKAYLAACWQMYLAEVRDRIEEEELNPDVMLLDASRWTKTLIHYAQVSLTPPTPENLATLVDEFDLSDIKTNALIWPFVCNGVAVCLEEGLKLFEGSQHLVSFDDMIYYPNVIQSVPVKQYDHIIVDEAQDTSRASLELMLKACHHNTQIFFVGDRRQSIYAFAGAAFNSIDQIIERLGAETLPLRICYRCGSSIVDLANQLVGEADKLISAGNHTGKVEVIGSEYLDRLMPGDAVLSRTTAKLIQACLKVLQMGKRAKVLGRNLGDSIAAIVTVLEAMRISRGKPLLQPDLSNLLAVLQEYHRTEAKSLEDSRENPEMALSELEDRVKTVQAFYEAYISKCNHEGLRMPDDPKCEFNRTTKDFKLYIRGLFSEDDNAKDFILFMTAHRSKGGEWDRVFIVGTDEFPHPKAKSDRQQEQETNLMYVAVTRAINELYFINAPFTCLDLEEQTRAVTVVSDYVESGNAALTPANVQFNHDENVTDATIIREELGEGKVSHIVAVEVLCPACGGACADPETGTLTITYDLVGHTVECSKCKKRCTVPLNAFSLGGDVVAREQPAGQTTKREKKGRTKKERKSTKGRKPEGKTVKEPLQLSLDVRVIRTLNEMRTPDGLNINKSKLFVELLEQYQPFIEKFAVIASEEDEELDHDEIEDEE